MIVGRLREDVIRLLNIEKPDDCMIYLGEQNISHMRSNHPKEYELYSGHIGEIIEEPDFVGYDVSDNSIEFIKMFFFNGEYVKLAVRATNSGTLYARTLYSVNEERVQSYIRKGKLKRVVS